MAVNPNMIGPRIILEHYIEEDYVKVPGYYEKGKDPHCRICKEGENWSCTPSICPNCLNKYWKAREDNKSIQGISLYEMGVEDYLVFRAINVQIKNGETPYATPEEFAKEVRERHEKISEAFRKENARQQALEDELYD